MFLQLLTHHHIKGRPAKQTRSSAPQVAGIKGTRELLPLPLSVSPTAPLCSTCAVGIRGLAETSLVWGQESSGTFKPLWTLSWGSHRTIRGRLCVQFTMKIVCESASPLGCYGWEDGGDGGGCSEGGGSGDHGRGKLLLSSSSSSSSSPSSSSSSLSSSPGCQRKKSRLPSRLPLGICALYARKVHLF